MKRYRPGSNLGPFFYALTMILSVLIVLGTSLFFARDDKEIELNIDEYTIENNGDGQIQQQALSGNGEFMLPSDSGSVVLVHKYTSSSDPICDDCGLIRFLYVKDLSAPVAGQRLDTSVSFTASAGASYRVSWSPADTYAKGSTNYTATMEFTPKSGYHFDSKLQATFDGSNISYTMLSNGSVRITKSFPKTAAVTPSPSVTKPVTVTPKPSTNTPKPTVSATPKPTVSSKPTPTTRPDLPTTPVPSKFPSPTKIPTSTPFPTLSPTATPSPTPTNTPRPTNTPKPTNTPVPTDTPVPTSGPTAAPKPTNTPKPTPATPYVVMPDVLGMNYHDAKSMVTRELKDGGFKSVTVEIVWVTSDDPETNLKVQNQDPEGDSYVELTDTSITVTLVVARVGDAPTPDPEPTAVPTGTPVTPTVAPTVAPTTAPTGTPSVTPKPGVTGVPSPTPDPNEPSFEDFVERLYVVALNRASEKEGKEFWVEKVENGEYNGADCARFFLLEAPEFMNRKLNDSRFLEVLYHTFYDRDPDINGMNYWLGRLKTDMTRAAVVNEFIESTEWCNVCATYSVRSGAIYHKAEFASRKAIAFATRLYTCCLGRDPEEKGLAYWSLALTNLEQTGYDAAKIFFGGEEFVNLKTTNKDYVERLYRTFLGREADEAGLNYWSGQLAAGVSREEVLKGFARSDEFEKLCKSCGIERGEIDTTNGDVN